MADLFGRDVKTIGKHINNALKEDLAGESLVAKFATPKKYGRHINNIFKEGELNLNITCANFVHTTRHGAPKAAPKKRISW